MKALIALEDGKIFEGRSFTGAAETTGEIVFNTSMTGYQEILTDPSYKGQIAVMTYPLIGNYGTNKSDMESNRIHMEAFIVREYQDIPSNFRSTATLGDFLREHQVPGIEGVDTRALTRHIRLAGAMKGIISTEDPDPESLVAKAKISPGLIGQNLVKEVTTSSPYCWSKDVPLPGDNFSKADPGKYRVVVLDTGLKYNQLRLLAKKGCSLQIVGAAATADEILSMNPDGIFLSNGPGDPGALEKLVETVKHLLGQKPVFGICLGHQILGLAYGGRSYKLKFGHRGSNQPVKNLSTGKVEITSQNHGFCIDRDSLNPDEVEITHINLNDNSLEGMRHKKYPAFSVQYHPEHAPGPHDSVYLFDRFIDAMQQHT